MNSMILVGLLAALTASVSAGFLSGGYSGGSLGGGYNGGLIASGPTVAAGPLATSSITQQRIVHTVPIPTRIISTPAIASTSYYSGLQGGYGGNGNQGNGNQGNGYLGSGNLGGGNQGNGFGSLNGGSLSGYGNLAGNYGGYGRNGY